MTARRELEWFYNFAITALLLSAWLMSIPTIQHPVTDHVVPRCLEREQPQGREVARA